MLSKLIAFLRKVVGWLETKTAVSSNRTWAQNVPPAVKNKHYRVALCFSGQVRNLDKGFEYIRKNILDVNKEDCDIDVFVHCWFDHKEIGKEFIAASGVPVKSPVTPTALMDIYKYYNPQKILAEKQIRFEDSKYYANKPDAIIPWYSLSKNYSLKRVFALKTEHEKQNIFTYDYVMSLRFDLGLSNPIVFRSFDVNKVSQSERGFVNGEGVDVTHAVLGGKLADKYASFFDFIDQYYNEGIRFCDEPLMHRHLDFHNIPYVRIPAMNDYSLLRS